MTELTVIGRKEKVKGKSDQGLNAFALLRLVILLLESENLVEDFLTSFLSSVGLPQARTCEDPACRPFSELRLASAEELPPVSVELHSASAGCLDSASSELRLCHDRCFLGVHCFLYQGAAEGLHSQHCYRCCHYGVCCCCDACYLDCRCFLSVRLPGFVDMACSAEASCCPASAVRSERSSSAVRSDRSADCSVRSADCFVRSAEPHRSVPFLP